LLVGLFAATDVCCCCCCCSFERSSEKLAPSPSPLPITVVAVVAISGKEPLGFNPWKLTEIGKTGRVLLRMALALLAHGSTVFARERAAEPLRGGLLRWDEGGKDECEFNEGLSSETTRARENPRTRHGAVATAALRCARRHCSGSAGAQRREAACC
jgi:hypothetical protein